LSLLTVLKTSAGVMELVSGFVQMSAPTRKIMRAIRIMATGEVNVQ